MRTKKIVIDSCEQCLMSESIIMATIPITVRYICRHPQCEHMDVTEAVNLGMIYDNCPLEDNSSEEYEECEECGTIDEAVEYREEIDGLGRYLCNMCYVDGKVEMKADES